MVLPLLPTPPVMPVVSTTVHVYVVPPTVLDKLMAGAVPLHIAVVDGVALITGIGLTVTVALAPPTGLPQGAAPVTDTQ